VLRKLGKTHIEENKSLYANAWRKLRRNTSAMVGLFLIIFAAMIAILGANIRPDSTQDANRAIPPIQQLKPGSVVNHLLVKRNDETKETGFFGNLLMGGGEKVYKYYPYLDYSIDGSQIIIEKFSKYQDASFYEPDYESFEVADVLYSVNYLRTENIIDNGDGTQTIFLLDSSKIEKDISVMIAQFESENLLEQKYTLGTDVQGRDLLSRLMAGTIVSLSVGLIAVIIALFIGVTMGMLAGYYRGWVDEVIMFVISVMWSIPGLLLVISFMLVMGRGFTTLFIGIGLIMWVDLARLVRGQVLSLREKEYIEAGKSLGFGDSRILFRHIFPNIIGPVIVQCANNFAMAILLEAGLSFLGIGVQIPMPSWGVIITNHQGFLTQPEYSYMAILPGVFIILLVFAFMLLGNGLRDAFDSKSVEISQ